MRIAIIGSGGVGGYFGARLAAAGNQVHFIARGSHLEAMRRTGLKVRSAAGDLDLKPVNVTDDPADVGLVDLVLIAVKLWDTAAAAQIAARLMGPQTLVISIQNGVEKDDVLRSFIPRDNLLGGLCYISAAIAEPGMIIHNGSLHRIVFGEFNHRVSERAAMLGELMTKAGIDVTVSDNIEREAWEKFVFLVGISTATSLTRMPIGPIREDPDTRAMLLGLMAEAAEVGRARGVTLAADYATSRLQFCDSLPSHVTSSMYTDLSNGNRLELPWLAGAVVRFGTELGVATPLNRFACIALKLHADGHASSNRA